MQSTIKVLSCSSLTFLSNSQFINFLTFVYDETNQSWHMFVSAPTVVNKGFIDPAKKNQSSIVKWTCFFANDSCFTSTSSESGSLQQTSHHSHLLRCSIFWIEATPTSHPEKFIGSSRYEIWLDFWEEYTIITDSSTCRVLHTNGRPENLPDEARLEEIVLSAWLLITFSLAAISLILCPTF